jgi:hypothetical protein
VPFQPRTRRSPRRRLYLTAEAERERNNASSAVNLLVGRGFIDAALTRWTTGGRVYADDNGKPRFLKELEPPPNDIWEIRVTEPAVQGRLLGAFLEQDTLILFRLHTRSLLGRKRSRAWGRAMSECTAGWAELFPCWPPLHADTIGDYISENYDDFELHR